jgi:hypothetical protein
MFLKNFHIFIKKQSVLQQKFTVQVTTLGDYDDITRFDGTALHKNRSTVYEYAQCKRECGHIVRIRRH